MFFCARGLVGAPLAVPPPRDGATLARAVTPASRTPVLFGILAWRLALGGLVARLERWPLGEGVCSALVTGPTVGCGDLVPRQPLSRLLAVSVGLFGTVLTGLVAAIAVRALQTATDDPT